MNYRISLVKGPPFARRLEKIAKHFPTTQFPDIFMSKNIGHRQTEEDETGSIIEESIEAPNKHGQEPAPVANKVNTTSQNIQESARRPMGDLQVLAGVMGGIHDTLNQNAEIIAEENQRMRSRSRKGFPGPIVKWDIIMPLIAQRGLQPKLGDMVPDLTSFVDHVADVSRKLRLTRKRTVLFIVSPYDEAREEMKHLARLAKTYQREIEKIIRQNEEMAREGDSPESTDLAVVTNRRRSI
ncbi:uncharacterized protein DSM5745_08093 [Aspergillus mulundensis]|uniref:Uncharacterized protein n=1 Tax=Aspergillus mulundensis TaxID=1810919 RepID=A0A3D8R952_9EURO|nr:hypothetical protein DSM5745_08093 [Aspergillus mulundensis]RDW70582.1 hypothetical protein DSM5745_08093 [Aspergillus mulundensis]